MPHTLTALTSKKIFKYKTDTMPHVDEHLFLSAIITAYSDAERINVIDNYLLFLRENFTGAEEVITYLQRVRQELKPESLKYKTIIINFNGSGCPPYLDSVHEEYLVSRLGKKGVAVKNMGGIGVDVNRSLFGNIIDFIFNRSMANRIQEALDYIRDNADSDCKIEILGHSRGAVQAIILARIVSQKYPQVKVIAHDPVPGKTLMPFLMKTWSNMSLNVSAFLSDTKNTLRTLRSILEDSALSIRGVLLVPWRDQDKRPAFALLDGKEVYKADVFCPVKLRGFHTLGLYNQTSIDYYVYWEKIPFIGKSLLKKNKKAFQGDTEIDSERPLIKKVMRGNYETIMYIFNEIRFENLNRKNDKDNNSKFKKTLLKKNEELDIYLDKLGLLYSEALSNPAYHAGQQSEFREVPEALSSQPQALLPKQILNDYTISLPSLLRNLFDNASGINNQELLYLTLHWLMAVEEKHEHHDWVLGVYIENIQYNLLSNPSIKHRVQQIGNFLGFDDIIQQILDWKNEGDQTVITQALQKLKSQHFSHTDRVLWDAVVNEITDKYKNSLSYVTPFQLESHFKIHHTQNSSNLDSFLQSTTKNTLYSPWYYAMEELSILKASVVGIVVTLISAIKNRLQRVFLLAVVIDSAKYEDKNQSRTHKNTDTSMPNTLSTSKLSVLSAGNNKPNSQSNATDKSSSTCFPNPLKSNTTCNEGSGPDVIQVPHFKD